MYEMRLEEVKGIFDRSCEVIYKIIAVKVVDSLDDEDVYFSSIRSVFQKSFLDFLSFPLSMEQIESQQQLPLRFLFDTEGETACEVAEGYFYDLMYEETSYKVPREIIEHVDSCRACGEKFVYSSQFIKGELQEPHRSYAARMTEDLYRHFSLLGKEVGCGLVKGFLPLLGDADMQMYIPTPVTVHLDNCEPCLSDRDTIRWLKLTSDQNAILAEFYAARTFESSGECGRFRDSLGAISRLCFEGVSSDALRHVCLCRECRTLVQVKRTEASREIIKSGGGRYLPCESVGAKDLFTYCLPYGLDPACDEYAKLRPAFTEHLLGCGKCLEKFRQLHNSLYALAQNSESGVSTYCELAGDSPEKGGFEKVEEIYDDWPFTVWVRDENENEIETTRESPEREVSETKCRLRGPALLHKLYTPAAAAVILVIGGLLLLFNAPAAKGVDYGGICQALGGVNNIFISRFSPRKTEPIQKIWMSRPLQKYILTGKGAVVEYDLWRKVKTKVNLDSGEVETSTFDDEFRDGIAELMDKTFGIMPYATASEIPPDANWARVEGVSTYDIGKNIEVFEFTWLEEDLEGRAIPWRRLYFIDADTKLPIVRKTWKKLSVREEYRLISLFKIEYPSADEIAGVIRRAGNGTN